MRLKHILSFALLLAVLIVYQGCNNEEGNVTPTPGVLQLSTLRIGTYSINLNDFTKNTAAPIDKPIVATFSSPLDTASARQNTQLRVKGGDLVPLKFSYLDNNKTFSAMPKTGLLMSNKQYQLTISNGVKGINGDVFPGLVIEFTTVPDVLQITSLKISDIEVLNSSWITDCAVEGLVLDVLFSHPVDATTITTDNIEVTNNIPAAISLALSEGNKKLTVTVNQKLKDLSKYQLYISNDVKGATGETSQSFSKYFYTTTDPLPDFPAISDDELLTLVQQQTFKYFYDYAHPASGMARERNTGDNTVTSGGTGFGIMAIIVGMERNFITRDQGVDHMNKIVSFLETADRFHGAWSHWINGNTGKVIPFSPKDNGGDLVETSFLVEGLLTFRQYLEPSDTAGNNLINRITTLWETVEWDWYRKNNTSVLYWHWSPNYNWDMNFPLYGYFEEQITYVLAAASPTHSIPKEVYSNGYGKNGAIVKNNVHYGIKLPLESPAPLFWVHYSYLGMNPDFSDEYANYWEQNVNATLINRAHCIANPKNYVGYSENCWGLTSSDDDQYGYAAHSPSNDLGVITPTAALSSFPYTPNESMKALKFFYYTVGDRLWGQYGFYDAFNLTEGWTANSYLAIDQGPIIVMIENYRSGLLWDLFMSAPEVNDAFTKLNFTK
jgi:hypothetical protein